jgi:hypothetical protein
MAKINEQTIVITVSELVKDNADIKPLLSPEIIAQLEAVITELAGPSTLVEITQP